MSDDNTNNGDEDSVVFVFDYDHTIVCENSDTFIPHLLEAKHGLQLIDEYRGGKTGWTQLMDSVVLACQQKDHKTVEDIAFQAACVPCFPELLLVLGMVAEKGPVHIVSDANSLYIDSFLKHHGVSVHTVHTNPAVLDANGLLRVQPYATKPHGCKTCPTNMCKGLIVREKILLLATSPAKKRPKIVYFGDGSNDFCPVLAVLREGDVVFARDDPNEPRARGLMRKIDENPLLVRAQVIRWAVGKDLLELVKQNIIMSTKRHVL